MNKRLAKITKPNARVVSHGLDATALLCPEREPKLDLGMRAQAASKRAGGAPALEAMMPESRLISIVEDDHPFRESMRKLMSLLGYKVEAFASPASFLASPFLSETACLVADVHMPGMTGVELNRHLLDAGYRIPTILVTAYPDEGIRKRALKDGVLCYLSKPVDDEHLERCIRSALQSKRSDDSNS